MEHEFWHDRWRSGRIAFHEGEPNRQLTTCLHHLGLPRGARVFVPLCGKTRDIGWLLDQGYRVVGAELSRLAVDELFAELELEPAVTDDGVLRHHTSPELRVHVGDVFDLTPATLGAVDAVYDRAALVALPTGLRDRYVEHLERLTGPVPSLLLTVEYDTDRLTGPPFSIDADEVERRFGERREIRRVGEIELPGGLRGVPARETAWVLSPR